MARQFESKGGRGASRREASSCVVIVLFVSDLLPSGKGRPPSVATTTSPPSSGVPHPAAVMPPPTANPNNRAHRATKTILSGAVFKSGVGAPQHLNGRAGLYLSGTERF